MGKYQIITSQQPKMSNKNHYLDFSRNRGRGTGFLNPITINQKLFNGRVKSTEEPYDALNDIKYNPKFKSNIPSIDIKKTQK